MKSLTALLVYSIVTGSLLAACAPAAPSPTAPPAKPPATAPKAEVSPAAKAPQAVAKPAEKPAHSAEVQRLLAAARDKGERELNLSWAEDNLGGSEAAKKWEGLFNRMYGTSVAFQFTPGPRYPDAAAKIVQEVAAGQVAFSDLLAGAGSHIGPLVGRGVVEEYDYTLLSPRITGEILAPNNSGIELRTNVPGIAYNETLVSLGEVPKKLEDVLNPKWKGKVATTQNASYFDSISMRSEWGAQKMKAYVARLSEQAGGLIAPSDLERVASGEFVMLAMNAGNHEVKPLKQKGAPLGFTIPEDGPLAIYTYFAVPRNAAHPNLAKLMVNTVMSEEGQKIFYETQLTDHHALPGSQAAADLSQLRAKGIALLNVNAKFYVDHPELSQLGNELRAILRDGSRG